MRIIAGIARGRTLIAPKGQDTRPTLDRVRESLFNILRPRLEGAVVLDLFAGSGALGLEAISRGAQAAVFVDHARAAQAAVTQNIAALGVQAQATLLPCDWRTALRRLSALDERFTLVFLDPPYQMAQAGDMLSMLRDSGILAVDALVVYEHAQAMPPDDTGWQVADMRRYGDTAITFLTLPQKGDNDANGAISGEL